MPADHSTRLRHITLLAAIGSLAAAHAVQAAPASPPALALSPRAAGTAPTTTDTVLKRLPAGAEQLTFRGETASRSFTVPLSRSEAARADQFQISLLNAVSLLPDRSTMKLIINGTVVAAVTAGSPGEAARMSIRLPSGLLVPGQNTVQITTALSHRVDCSVQATYELWAKLDPAQTGFLVPREAAFQIRSLDDLAFEPLADDGTTRIHLRVAKDDADLLEKGAGLVDALVRRAGLSRPVVDVGPERGTGPGFDLILGASQPAGDDLVILGRGNGATIGRDRTDGRLVVMVDGTDAAAIGGAPAPASARLRNANLQSGVSKTLADLGLMAENFSGRHFLSTLDITLPPDFLASNERARLLLDGGHAATLVEGSGLTFRVNGTLVSSMPLAAGRSERFQHAIVELPLRFFRPGHNEISIEGSTMAAADAQCDTIAMPRDPRLTIAGTSVLDFPTFAHLGTLPQIPAALASDGRGDVVHLYLPGAQEGSVGAGLTVLANMATQNSLGAPQLHFAEPGEFDPPGIVIGSRDALPESLGGVLARLTTPRPAADALAIDPPGPVPAGGGESASLVAPAITAASLSETAGLVQTTVIGRAQRLLRDRGFFFGHDEDAALTVAPGDLLVAAVAPQADAPSFGGIALPQVTRNPAHWLVLTTEDRTALAPALAALVAGGHWTALAGQAMSFDPASDGVQVLAPRRVSYVLPERLKVADIRPILGDIMSYNVVLSIALLFALIGILGTSVHVILGRIGVR